MAKSNCTMVVKSLKRIGGDVEVRSFDEFKRLTDSSLSIDALEDGFKGARAKGLVKLKKRESGRTRARLTAKATKNR